jgi:hypothetical protein
MGWQVIQHLSSPTSDLFSWSGLSLGSYQRVCVMFDDITVGTDGAFITLQLSTGSGFNTAGYRFAGSLRSSSTATDTEGSESAAHIKIGGTSSTWGVGNAANETISGRCDIGNLGSSLYKVIETNASIVAPSGSMTRFIGAGLLEQTAAIDGVRLGVSTGTLTAGKATLYGLRTS